MSRARGILGDGFLGAYLQGSIALGDADMYSDCDFLIVTAGPIMPPQEQGLRRLHDQLPTRPGHWPRHIEGSYAPRDELRDLTGLGKEWLFVDHGGRELEWSTHCNSEIVRWILHEHGLTLAGPDAKNLVDQVSPDALRARAREDAPRFLADLLTWIGLDGAWAVRYAVTTLCRILFTLDTGKVASKRGALVWAGESLGPEWRDLVTQTLQDRSLGWNHEDPPRTGTVQAMLALNDYVRRRAAA